MVNIIRKMPPQPPLLDSGTKNTFIISESDLPLAVLQTGVALAIICGTEGPSYRPCGAGMAIMPDGRTIGNLSAGCIDQDVRHHALAALESSQPQYLRYGAGSSFKDLQLPCGGGLDILIEPCLDPDDVARARSDLAARQETALELRDGLCLRILPDLRFVVFGKGPEARVFAKTVYSAGYSVELYASDQETIDGIASFPAELLVRTEWPDGLAVDARSAVTMFFHEHEREITLLKHALSSSAFYVGAMGSRRAAQVRTQALSALGVAPEQTERLVQPFGLIASARSPRSLAVSVLADVISKISHV